MEDIFEMTDQMRRQIPQIIKEEQEFLEYIKKNFLIISQHDLVKNAIEQTQLTVNMLQTAILAMYTYYQNTNSSQAIDRIMALIESCEKQKKFIENLKKYGYQTEKVKLVHMIEAQVKEQPKVLNNLLTIIELMALSDEENDE